MTQLKKRILLVDDHEVVREGLKLFLLTQPDFELVGEAENGREAVNKAISLRPDLVLMDIVMPEMDGIAATAEIKRRLPQTVVLVLTTFIDDKRVLEAVRAGANGYLLKNLKAAELGRAIHEAVAGRPQMHPDAAQALLKATAQRNEPAPEESLTERERQVLLLIATGNSNKEIALTMNISETTVKSHVGAVLQKLKLADRTQAALYAVKHGLVEQ